MSKRIGQPGNDTASLDPLRLLPSDKLQDGDHFLLVFGDGRRIFGQCCSKKKGQTPPVKINKKSYSTHNLIGLPYGSVLEQGSNQLVPLAPGEGLMPSFPAAVVKGEATSASTSQNNSDNDNDEQQQQQQQQATRDNRHIVDNNTSQALDQKELMRLRASGADGSAIVEKIIENSATFAQKTDFSRAKYVARKQLKYQPRCRLVRCSGSTICEALYVKDPKKYMNLREDTLGQILSYSNVSAGCQILLLETCFGVVTGAFAQRLGGYGKILSIYSGQQPSFNEMLSKFNLTFSENISIKWVHSGDVFRDEDSVDNDEEEEEDLEKVDRDEMKWPCPLQDHTRRYMKSMRSRKEQTKFLAKRSSRFSRKLVRHTPLEGKKWLKSRHSDSVVIVARYDPTETLLQLLPYLAPSCPFVVYCEFIEPLTTCFLELQRNNLAINLRLSDTWARAYQVLPGRTHPSMNMSQSGGFILTGTKLDPLMGVNELDEELLKEIRAQIGGRRGRSKQKPDGANDNGRASKRQRVDK